MRNLFQKSIAAFVLTLLFSANAMAVSIPHKTNITEPTKDITILSDSTLLDSAYNSALKEFKNSSKAEKKAKIKDAKKIMSEYKAKKKAGDDVSTNEILLAILCVILPPLAVYLHQGKVTNNKFWISLVLTLLILVPGIIYSLLVVFGGL